MKKCLYLIILFIIGSLYSVLQCSNNSEDNITSNITVTEICGNNCSDICNKQSASISGDSYFWHWNQDIYDTSTEHAFSCYQSSGADIVVDFYTSKDCFLLIEASRITGCPDGNIIMEVLNSNCSLSGTDFSVTCSSSEIDKQYIKTFFMVQANQHYYIWLGEGINHGWLPEISLAITEATQSAGENCNNAINVTGSSSFLLTTSSRFPFDAEPCFDGDITWLVYKLSQSNTVLQATSDILTGMAFYSGICGSLSLIECDYLTYSIRTELANPGESIYIAVESTTTSMNISITESFPSLGDSCGNMLKTADSTNSGSGILWNISKDSSNTWSNHKLRCDAYTGGDAVIEFISPTDSILLISVSSIGADADNISVEILKGNCINGTSLFCTSTATTNCYYGIFPNIGDKYYIWIANYTSNGGLPELEVFIEPITPTTGELCSVPFNLTGTNISVLNNYSRLRADTDPWCISDNLFWTYYFTPTSSYDFITISSSNKSRIQLLTGTCENLNEIFCGTLSSKYYLSSTISNDFYLVLPSASSSHSLYINEITLLGCPASSSFSTGIPIIASYTNNESCLTTDISFNKITVTGASHLCISGTYDVELNKDFLNIKNNFGEVFFSYTGTGSFAELNIPGNTAIFCVQSDSEITSNGYSIMNISY